MNDSAPGGIAGDAERAESRRWWWPAVATLAVAVIVGTVLRFWADTPLWLDEALSVHIARLPLGEIPAALRMDGHPPLYYVALHVWISLFGESDVAVRSLSAVCSLLTIPALWWAVRPRGDRVTWIAVGLLAVSPFAIRYATEARMYSLVMLLVAIGWGLVERAVVRPTLGRLAGVAVVSSLLLYTHYWSLFLLAASGLVLAWSAIRRGVPGAWKVMGAIVVGGLTFLPWLPSFLTQLRHTGTPWGEASRPADVVWLSLVDFAGGPFSEPQIAATLVAALIVVGLFGRTDPRPSLVVVDREPVAASVVPAVVVALTLSIGWAASAASSSTFQTRYASFVLPFLLVLVALGLVRIGSRLVALVLFLVLVGAGWLGVIEEHLDDRTQAGDIADALDADAAPADVIVFCPDQLGPAVVRELETEPGLMVTYPSFGNPERVDWTDYAERHADAFPTEFADQLVPQVPPGGRIWLVERNGYRTLDGACAELVSILAARQGLTVVLEEDVAQFYEPATLYVTAPVAS